MEDVKKSVKPVILRPFDDKTFAAIQEHVKHIRMAFDAPGAIYHDVDAPENNKFNRFCWHNLPKLVELHHSPKLITLASETFGVNVKPSYAFLSMYGPDGVCPKHTDRPQCQFTIDLVLNQDAEWPIYVDGVAYSLKEGEALCYSGTGQEHYRNPMNQDSKATYIDLAFFHWVPTNWIGRKE